MAGSETLIATRFSSTFKFAFEADVYTVKILYTSRGVIGFLKPVIFNDILVFASVAFLSSRPPSIYALFPSSH